MHRRRQQKAAADGHPDSWDRSPSARPGYSGGHGKPRGVPKVYGGDCVLAGCGRPQWSGELCNMHRQRKRRARLAGHPDEWDRSPRPPGTRRAA